MYSEKSKNSSIGGILVKFDLKNEKLGCIRFLRLKKVVTSGRITTIHT